VLKIAQIGAGRFGIHHIKILARSRNAELVAVCDASEERLKEAAAVAPKATRTQRIEDIFENGAIDAVMVVTNSETHAELALKAIRAGKHCFVEKPLALSREGGERLVKEAADKKRVLAVGHLLKYHPAYEKLQAIASAGELGRVHYFYSVRLNLGTVRKAENALWSLAPHDVLAMLDLAGRDPVTASATGGAYLQKKIHDVAFFTLAFGEGVVGQGHVSWLDPQKIRRLTVVGDKKMAVVDDLEPVEKLRVYDLEISSGSPPRVAEGSMTAPKLAAHDPLEAELEDFVKCAGSGGTPRADGREGLRVVRVLEAAQRSLEQGGAPVEVR
jgi:predicted dehydrogenase